jgi:hypothetical protein
MKLRKFWPYIIIAVLGLVLRLCWDPHQIIWSYDQARDSFFMREMIVNRDLILLGPQTEVFGLFHGPLYYYLFAPFYALSKGEPGFPLILMSILNLTAAIPLALIGFKITKSRLAGIFTFAVFVFSYAFTEYSRWLSNVSITIPFIAWGYYLLYEILEEKRGKIILFLLGLTLGLAVQGEIFFLSLIAVFFLVLVFKKTKFNNLFFYAVGAVAGMLPIIIAQFKFNFQGGRILLNILSGGTQVGYAGLWTNFTGYFNHLGLTFFQTIGAPSILTGLILLFLILFLVGKKINKTWLTAIVLGHAVLFVFEYINVVFLDIGLAILLIVLFGAGSYFLFKFNRIVFAIAVFAFVFFQFNLYKSYLVGRSPFGGFNFIHPGGGSTLTDYDDIAAKMYEISGEKEFSISVIGTPFGVRTVWASVFELYSRRHGVPIPRWFEYYANGYPGDNLLVPSSKPGQTHFLVLESNIENLLASPIITREMGNQDNNTKKVDEFTLHGATIQVRKPVK